MKTSFKSPLLGHHSALRRLRIEGMGREAVIFTFPDQTGKSLDPYPTFTIALDAWCELAKLLHNHRADDGTTASGLLYRLPAIERIFGEPSDPYRFVVDVDHKTGNVTFWQQASRRGWTLTVNEWHDLVQWVQDPPHGMPWLPPLTAVEPASAS